MRLTVLGSSGGYPAPGSACSGYLIESGTTRLWVDAGTGTLDALLRLTDVFDLAAVWISHLHADHWTDLPIALHQMAVTMPTDHLAQPVTVFGPPGWEADTGIAKQWFATRRTPYVPVEVADGASYRVGSLTLRAAAVAHSVQTFALRVEDRTSSITYSADTSPCESLVDLAAGTDLFLCEATLAAGEANSISTSPEGAAGMAARAHVRRLVLTHLLPGVDAATSLATASGRFSRDVQLAVPNSVHET